MPTYDAREHLRSLLGVELRTVGRPRPNRVLDVGDDEVIVATERAPAGEPVPITSVQRAGEQLLAEGD